jgi:hypothetical protein
LLCKGKKIGVKKQKNPLGSVFPPLVKAVGYGSMELVTLRYDG